MNEDEAVALSGAKMKISAAETLAANLTIKSK